MPSLVPKLRLCLQCIVLVTLAASHARADQRVEAPQPVAAAATATLGLLNPVALLSQAIAALIGGDGNLNAPRADLRYAAALVGSLPQAGEMAVRFASNAEHNRVSLLLAESQVRVRLAQDLLLRCEVSSRDEANTDAELKFDLGVQFKFR